MLSHPTETSRLRVRRLEPGDWEMVHSYTSDPDVMARVEEGRLTESQTRAFVTENAGERPKAYAVVRRGERDLIGHALFQPWFGPRMYARMYEIGWVFHKAHHGKGYATEAALALLEYGFERLGLHRVISTCQPENIASYRVMEKLGMRREAHFRKCLYRGGDTWWDEYFYAMLAEEWFETGRQSKSFQG